MSGLVRLQLSRKKGFSLQAASRAINGRDAVSVARPSKWGNPWRVRDPVYLIDKNGRAYPRRSGMTPRETVARHRESVEQDSSLSAMIVRELRGKNIACACGLDQPCHGDTYLELANRPIMTATPVLANPGPER